MTSYYYLTFHSSSYDTSKTYSSRLQVMSKNSLVSIGRDLDMNIPTSWTKAKMAAHISSFVVAHPEQMVAMLDDEEIVLAHEIVEAGKQGVVVWKRHLLKYDHLKKMVWVLVNGDNKGKDGFVMVDEIRDAFAPYIELCYESAKENVESKNISQSRFYLKDLRTKLDALDVEQLKYLHLLFEINYLDSCDFWFRDEWFLNDYHECFYDWYEAGCKDFPYNLNQFVFEVLKEWKERGYGRYRKAMDDIKRWYGFKWVKFDSVHAVDVAKAYDAAIVLGQEREISRCILPFIQNIHEYIRNKQYLEAISLIFCLFDHLGKACKKHEEWFDGFLNAGVQSSVVIFLDVLRHLYCHLRHHQDISWQVKEAMDLHLMVTNKYHRLFGDLEIAWGDSRLEDMLSDDSPYCDYSDIEDELYDYLKKMVGEDR